MSEIIKAIEEDHFLKVKQTIKAGADLNQLVETAEDEETPLLFFALRCRVSCDIIKLLIDSGADFKYLSDEGVGLLDEAVIFSDLETLSYLVDEKNMNLDETKRKSGLTPFIQSCCFGKLDIIEFIIKKGVDIHKKDNNGMSGLDYSKRLGQKKVTQFLKELE